MATAALALLNSKVGSSVENAVKGAIGSLVGVIDPGKARDAQRLARANLWYGWAVQGSLYAARMVLAGGNASPATAFYTIKEKGYYDANWAKLKASNPQLAQQALIAGPVGKVPENPGAADIAAVTNDLTAIQQQQAFSASQAATYGGTSMGSMFTPTAGAPAPLAVVPVARTVPNQTLATAAPAEIAPVSTRLYLALGVLVFAALVYEVVRHNRSVR